MPKEFSDLPIASVPQRLAALGYDVLILAGLIMVYGFAFMMLAGAVTGLDCKPDELDYSPCVGGPLYQLGILGVIAAYYIYSWRGAGQTVGMRAWRLLLANHDGTQLSYPQCFKRCLVGPISLVAAGLGFFWGWIDKNGASWHDLASGSEMRVLPKKKKS
ncbi:RDD family protein [Biformimicrobium ophioploci]|uniref:RDD family protein n=1 Tax=Biformimicrobium ophioploci TaxID=3036711 RepID=A0ABQ6LXA0_9GAMM|nr:RDD family protein [Microbulbifer sp. NKW57]GMG86741.1 RDD family protein [Microbulbifer sp. NKW57]